MTGSPFLLIAVVCVALVAVGALLRWMMRCYRRPDGAELIVALLLGLVVLEASLYEDQDTIPTSLFHLQAGSLSFRLYDVLVPLAVIARLLARPASRLRPLQVGLWSAFLIWLIGEMIEGFLGGNPKDFITYEAKIIIYLGTMMLVAAVPARRWLESPALRRVVAMASVLSLILIATTEAHIAINAGNPILPLVNLGDLGADAASVFSILGVCTLAVGLASDEGRLRMVLISLPLLGSPLVSGQRAAMIGMGASVVIVLAVLLSRRRLVKVTSAEIVLVVMAAAGVISVVILLSAMTSKSHVSFPLANQINAAFNSQGKQESATDRINQWAQARHLIAQRPWFGWGLGHTYQYYSPGFYEFMTTDLTHNITLDLLVRTGVVGLLLYLAAVIASLRDLLASWRNVTDPRVAALAAAVGAAFIGLIIKGQFESIFEKYRLAMMMGMLIGVSTSFAAERLEARQHAVEGRRVQVSARGAVTA